MNNLAQSNDCRDRRREFAGVLVIFVVTFVAYLPALRGGFIWDDAPSLTENPLIPHGDGLFYFWFTNAPNDYFPLTFTSFWLEWRLWGMNPMGYHLTNILLHAFNSGLLWRVLRRLEIRGAFLCAMIFAVHPVCVASVAWIAERKNTLSLFFFLLAVLFYFRFDVESRIANYESRSRKWYWLSVLAFLLALFSKTSVVVFPAILLLHAWWKRGRLMQQDLLRAIPFFVLSLALGWLTIWFQAHHAIGEGTIVQGENLWQRAAAAGWAVWFYIYKVLLPVWLSAIYPRWVLTSASLLDFLPLLFLFGMLCLGWWYREKWGRHLLFGLGYFSLTLLPILGFVDMYYLTYSRVADHWAYLSLPGMIVLVIGMGNLLGNRKRERAGSRMQRALVSLAVAAVCLLGFLTFQRAKLYASELNLWRDTVQKNPKAWCAYNNLGLALFNRGERVEAMRAFEESLRLNPTNALVHNNVGAILYAQVRTAEAVDSFRAAVRFDPGYAGAHNNLGNALLEQGQMAEAMAEINEALRLKPNFPEAHGDLGRALVRQGRAVEAMEEFATALSIKPDYAEAHNYMGSTLLDQGNLEAAVTHFAAALKIKPGYAEAHNHFGLALQAQGKIAEAVVQFKEALRLKADYPSAHNNLGRALAAQGKITEAQAQLAKALRLKPDYADAHFNAGQIFFNQGNMDEAARHYSAALQSQPDNAEAHYQLAVILAGQKQFAEAIVHFRDAVRLKPDWVEALNNLAWILATHTESQFRDGKRAVELAARAVTLTGTNNAGALDTLAAAYAETADSRRAVETAQLAIALARATGNKNLAEQIQTRKRTYESGQPFRE